MYTVAEKYVLRNEQHSGVDMVFEHSKSYVTDFNGFYTYDVPSGRLGKLQKLLWIWFAYRKLSY